VTCESCIRRNIFPDYDAYNKPNCRAHKAASGQGVGVGDDRHSWCNYLFHTIIRLNPFEPHHRAYDGDRAPHSGKWGDGSARDWCYGIPWKAGDIAGFACDLDLENSSKTITFYLNGKSMGVAFSNVDFDSGLSPAMTVQVLQCASSHFDLFLKLTQCRRVEWAKRTWPISARM
jgi:hypothetical protein